MRRSVAIAAAVAAVSHMSHPARADEVLTPARVFASPDLSGPRARGVQMAPDGSAVTYLKTKPDDISVTDLWITEVADGTSRLLIDGAALARRRRMAIGPTACAGRARRRGPGDSGLRARNPAC